MFQILDEVYAVHNAWEIESGKVGKRKWYHGYNELVYRSPSIGAKRIYFEFGFDFQREENHWSVSDLGFPSAYFGIHGEDVSQQDWSMLPDGWGAPPISWNWSSRNKVKQLSALTVGGSSLRNVYLGFFLDAFAEAQKAFVV